MGVRPDTRLGHGPGLHPITKTEGLKLQVTTEEGTKHKQVISEM